MELIARERAPGDELFLEISEVGLPVADVGVAVEWLESEHPKLIVSSQRKELRKDRVLIDWSQNDEHKTTVGVYSLRARERPTVSTPLAWEELDDPDALVFEAADVLERVEHHGDLFAPVAELRQELPDL